MTMVATVKRIIGNENGFVLGASILISAILLLAGVLALWTSNTEMHVVRNEGDLTLEFYNAEGGVIDALENYDTGTMQWLTDAFLSAGETAANSTIYSKNAANESVAKVEVRCINDNTTALPISGLSAAANNLPHQRHIAPPPEGSGYSLKYFEVRRYGITATSATGNTQVQVGAYKVFNKY
jgi:hypothetical protein